MKLGSLLADCIAQSNTEFGSCLLMDTQKRLWYGQDQTGLAQRREIHKAWLTSGSRFARSVPASAEEVQELPVHIVVQYTRGGWVHPSSCLQWQWGFAWHKGRRRWKKYPQGRGKKKSKWSWKGHYWCFMWQQQGWVERTAHGSTHRALRKHLPTSKQDHRSNWVHFN